MIFLQDKFRRQAIRSQLKQKEREQFMQSLPADQRLFKQLFDYLDKKLHVGCNHTDKLTRAFLNNNNCCNVSSIIEWLNENGGFCDCEVLLNAEQIFQDMKIHYEW
jgi:hypothetical protein